MGSELRCTPGKRGVGRLYRSFFLREFFSRALLSERLEQARRKPSLGSPHKADRVNVR